MSVKSSKSSKVAYMQEEDDKGNICDDVVYAASAAPSPSKQQMNISRKKSRRSDSPSGAAANLHTDSDSTVHPSRRESRSGRSSRPHHRDRSVPPEKKVVSLSSSRPAPRHSNTEPAMDSSHSRRRSRDIEPTYYGADPASITSASSRPRSKTAAPRPSSYYGPSRPPVSNSRFHGMMAHPPPPAGQLPPSAYGPPPSQQWPPPPPPAGFGMMGPPPLPLPVQGSHAGPPPGGPPLPFHHGPYVPAPLGSAPGPRSLHNRFGLNRPQTAMGHRPPPAVEYGHPDGSDADELGLSQHMHRMSLSRPGLEDGRLRGMPMRPMSARPLQGGPFAAPPPPPPPPAALEPFQPLPQPLPPVQPFQPLYDDQYDESPFQEYGPVTHVPRTRRGSIDPSLYEYEPRQYVTEVARTTGSRRNSFYGGAPSTAGSFEDQLRLATSYQEETSGGMRLTAERLHEASRRGGPKSRSTRSSDSRDESDWRQSATTRTTRSSNEEDLTIRIKGPALFKYGDAEMQCQDGTEINIRGPPNNRRISATERPGYAEIEDRRSRFERPALRSRAASQAGSVFAPPPGAPYDYSYGVSPEYGGSPFDPLPAPHPHWM